MTDASPDLPISFEAESALSIEAMENPALAEEGAGAEPRQRPPLDFSTHFSAEQAADLDALLAEVAALRTLQGDGEYFKAMAGWLNEAVPNWHQATIYFATTEAPEDEEMRRRAPRLYCGSFLIVLVQLLTLMAVLIGTLATSCVKAAHCQPGKYCRHGGEEAHGRRWAEENGVAFDGIAGGHPGDGIAGRCEFCAR
jgi:hypothetical protein